MTVFRTCTGCLFQPGYCGTRETFKASIKGLQITSVKWRCKGRIARFAPGDPVWALTAADRNEVDEETGQPYMDHFPAVIVEQRGSKALLHIADGALGRSGDSKFVPSNNGFCMIPLSRVEPREGTRERICFYCSMPESLDHLYGHACGLDGARKWIGGEPAEESPKGNGYALPDCGSEI